MRHEVINASVDRFEKCAERKMKGPGQSGRRRRGGGRREKELKRIHWHKNKPGQVSAPLILDPTVKEMSKEMKSFEDLEKVTG